MRFLFTGSGVGGYAKQLLLAKRTLSLYIVFFFVFFFWRVLHILLFIFVAHDYLTGRDMSRKHATIFETGSRFSTEFAK